MEPSISNKKILLSLFIKGSKYFLTESLDEYKAFLNFLEFPIGYNSIKDVRDSTIPFYFYGYYFCTIATILSLSKFETYQLLREIENETK